MHHGILKTHKPPSVYPNDVPERLRCRAPNLPNAHSPRAPTRSALWNRRVFWSHRAACCPELVSLENGCFGRLMACFWVLVWLIFNDFQKAFGPGLLKNGSSFVVWSFFPLLCPGDLLLGSASSPENLETVEASRL